MSIEHPDLTKDADSERGAILQKAKEYFKQSLEGLEESSPGEQAQEEIVALNAILDAMDQDDFGPAYRYLEEELEKLKKRIVEVSGNEIRRKDTVLLVESEISRVQKLLDSLQLKEK